MVSIVARDVALPTSSSVVAISRTCGRDDSGSVSATIRGRGDADREPGLHVEHARAEKTSITLFERHAGQLADGPDSIEMTDEQHARPGTGPFGDDMSGGRSAVDAADRGAGALEPLHEDPSTALERGRIGARRLFGHQVAGQGGDAGSGRQTGRNQAIHGPIITR